MKSQCLMLESQSVRHDIYITWQLYTLHVMILTKYSNYKSPSYQDEISCHPLKQNLQRFHIFFAHVPGSFWLSPSPPRSTPFCSIRSQYIPIPDFHRHLPTGG